MFKGKPRFEQLDQYVAKKEYALALEAIADEIKRRPESFNLLLREADILAQAGEREQAISTYRKLAQHYTEQGFYGRAIAVANKIQRLDPSRQDVTRELAAAIAAQQETERASRARLSRAADPTPPPIPAPPAAAGADGEPGPADEPPPPHVPAPEDVTPTSLEPPQQVAREREASKFFAAFPRAALEELLSSTCVRTFEAAEVVVREGDPGTSLFLIENGSVEVHTTDPAGAPVVLAVLGPGDFFGEVAVLTGRPRTATIVTREPVTLIEITRWDLERIAGEHPEVRAVLERFYTQRAHATVETMLARLRSRNA